MIKRIKETKATALTALLCAIGIIIVVSFINLRTAHVPHNTIAESLNTFIPSYVKIEKVRSDKWIVITSIHGMTPAIQQMSLFSDYRVVVVMDEGSKPVVEADENIVFLTLEMQRALRFDIFSHLPMNSYTRKNIGYLYAIANGARQIYDTDDDNFLEYAPRNRTTIMAQLISCVPQSDNLALNPYAAFGHPEIWPRGFPLEHTALECTGRGSRRGTTHLPLSSASIWQGLADLDPDVDAVFRMTHTDVLKRVIFPRKPPVFIGHDAFAPFNSQNTMFFADAFWALYLPSSVSFRLTDIWRGYFVQKMLRYTNTYLAFVGPTVEQFRNAHDYLSDYFQERQMYEQTTRLLRFLDEWEPPSNARFFATMIALATDMAREGFWHENEVLTLQAWIEDLRNVHYKEPQLVREEKRKTNSMHLSPFALCAQEFDGPRIQNAVHRWWDHQQETNAPATFLVSMDTRGFGAYLYDILFSASHLLQVSRSIAYNKQDRSAYDSTFCKDSNGLLCFFEMKNTNYGSSELASCTPNNVESKYVCSFLSAPNALRGAIAGEAIVQLAKADIVPTVLRDAGWSPMHWFGFLTQQLTHPNAQMSDAILDAKKKMKWNENERCAAVHMRLSDKIIEYTSHEYPSVYLYVREVERIIIENPSVQTVFITSDNRKALEDFVYLCRSRIPHVRVVFNDEQPRFDGKECGAEKGRCPTRNNLSDAGEKRAWAVNSMVDFYLLSSCDYLVGSFASFFTKAAAYRMIGKENILNELHGEDRFRSIDDDDSLQVWSPEHTVTFDIPTLKL